MPSVHGSCSRLVLCVVLVVGTGCGSRPADRVRAPTEEQLYKLGKAYTQATYRLDRAPVNFEEIKPDLEGAATEDLLRSPEDGDPFVIHWGVDFRKVPPRRDPFTVAAYEKHGREGSRYVLLFPLRIERMTDEAFGKAIFPAEYPHPP